ncbi:putative flavoprotein involved in K+ transport [Mumia flava]|uniref:Putative flavoprotein involved in K+ transport n=1 Tax=Mumia flava TaxID=1348852 RepID=A0A0B2BRA8_9ACTN|nr:FAD-dependent oxidoreductase [Mumia flava]PJJ56209.1 putative flavoprotein involved in K+ transport [Mumia flava]
MSRHTTENVETLIVGAGQTGLATAYHLKRTGHDALVLDANERVGDNWRRQWDSLRLYTPARYDGLPGLPFPGDPWSFPGKDDVADYLEAYAEHHALPVRLGTRVRALDPDGGGGFVATTSDGLIRADQVVVATGTFGRTPYVPAGAAELDDAIVQLHSSRYRRPGQLPDGRILVVGAAHSGTDIAYELAESRPVTLCGRDVGELPVTLGSGRFKAVFPLLLFVFGHVLTRRTPIGRKKLDEVRHHGGPALRVKRADLAARGVVRTEARFAGADDGSPVLDDGTVVDAAAVVWCTGFRQAFDWIHLDVIGDDGWPREYRGVVADVPGLYFCGLSFQFGFASMLLPGASRDAAYVACRIDERVRSRTRRPVAA